MMRPVRVIHCFRAPVGGLFRHVRDLASAQAAAGYEVGIFCDSTTGDSAHADRLAAMEPCCALGIRRLPISRTLAPGDFHGVRELAAMLDEFSADVVHGHGAKGGAFARLAAMKRDVLAIYTPHGGSLHYSTSTPAGFVFLVLERILGRRTDGIVFESRFSRDAYLRKIGQPSCPVRVIPNGLAESEFVPVECAPNASDFLFVGELRDLKGVDVMLRALAAIRAERPVTATIVGAGPDGDALRALATSLGLAAAVSFPGAMPARDAFQLGQCLVVPSRKESFPYIVLEAAAAGKPMIATNVGGIPEIYGDAARMLVEPDNVEDLTAAMRASLDAPELARQRTAVLAHRVAGEFSIGRMVSSINSFYGECAVTSRRTARRISPLVHPAE